MKTIIKKSLSYAAGVFLANAAIRKATEQNLCIAVTIVDESGIMKFFARMDHSPLVSIDASRKKALTAVGMGLSSGDDWFNFIKDDPIMWHGVQQFKDFILLGGGSPIMSDGELIGAIGVSGGHYKQDELCVHAALEAFKNFEK